MGADALVPDLEAALDDGLVRAIHERGKAEWQQALALVVPGTDLAVLWVVHDLLLDGPRLHTAQVSAACSLLTARARSLPLSATPVPNAGPARLATRAHLGHGPLHCS